MSLWTEPARDLQVVARPDVLVVGAGCAGIAAAVASARRGADTLLIEATTSLGGLATVGLINLLLTLDDGAGTQVVAGLCQEFVDQLAARGEAIHPPPESWGDEDAGAVDTWRRYGLIWGAPEAVRYSVAFDPEAFVDVALDLLPPAATLQLQTWFAGVAVVDGAIGAVFVETKRGREAIVPRVVVDATGDGDVFAAAGAPFEQAQVPPHLWFRAGNVGGDDGMPGAFAFRTTATRRALVPWPLVPGPDRFDSTDPTSVTAAWVASRRGARAEFDRLRREAPAFADAWLDGYASMIGVTESRRLVGDYVLTKDDADVVFADAIARTGHWTRRHVVFDIPYRCLTTAAIDNLLVAGRCISTTRYVHQATKEIPAAMATGEAAGAAAAAAASSGATSSVHAVDVDALRGDLEEGGAIVRPAR